MKVVCGWCDKHLEGKRSDKQVSHGMCDKCLEKQLKKVERLKSQKAGKGR